MVGGGLYHRVRTGPAPPQTAPDYPPGGPVPPLGERPGPCDILSPLFGVVRPPRHVQRPSGDPMAEILTESFCERCGSRYTFESAVPRARLRGVKVLSRGLKNFVLDDKTSIDEAMAAARDDTDRALTSQQLEAFHKTFNFCMQCRQYICPNCWNDGEGRCLTCAPMLGRGILPAPFPHLDPTVRHRGAGRGRPRGGSHGDERPHAGCRAFERIRRHRPPRCAQRRQRGRPGDRDGRRRGRRQRRGRAARSGARCHRAGDDGTAERQPGRGRGRTGRRARRRAGPVRSLRPVDAHAHPAPRRRGRGCRRPRPLSPPNRAVVAEPEPVARPRPRRVEPIDDTASTIDADGVDEAAGQAATAATMSPLLAGLRPGESLDEALAAFESAPTELAEAEPEVAAPSRPRLSRPRLSSSSPRWSNSSSPWPSSPRWSSPQSPRPAHSMRMPSPTSPGLRPSSRCRPPSRHPRRRASRPRTWPPRPSSNRSTRCRHRTTCSSTHRPRSKPSRRSLRRSSNPSTRSRPATPPSTSRDRGAGGARAPVAGRRR